MRESVDRLARFLASEGRAERSIRARPRATGGFEVVVYFGWGGGTGSGDSFEQALERALDEYYSDSAEPKPRLRFCATCSGCGVSTDGFEREEDLGAHLEAIGWRQYRPVHVLWKFCPECFRLAGERIEEAMRAQSGTESLDAVARLREILASLRGEGTR